MGAYDDYSPGAAAAKWLHPDGTVTDADGNTVSPPSDAGAADYASRLPRAAKWLLPDGTVTDALPGGPEGGDNGGGPATQVEVPIVSTEALGEVFLAGQIEAQEWRDDAAGIGVAATDSAAASVT
jgi:hypothetical protein